MTARKPVPTHPYRRKRQQLTNYRKRLHLLKGRTTRLVVRRSVHNMIMQLVDYFPAGDKVLVSVNSSELRKFGMETVNGNIPCAYLTGLLLAKRAQQKDVKKAVADIGVQNGSPRVFAALKGALDGGLAIPLGEGVVPPQERLEGQHVAANSAATYTRYKNPADYASLVASVKEKIQQS